MFANVTAESSSRITEIRDIVDFAKRHTPMPPTAIPRHINVIKGMAFVQLYGVIEYTVLTLVAETIDIINRENLHLTDIKPQLLSFALNSRLESLIHVTSKKWTKRHELFKEIESNPIIDIDTTLMPTDGKNFTNVQMQSIWDALCITEPLFHDIRFNNRLRDIVTNRINIAHGNISASDVGSTVTISDVYIRIDEVSKYCSYLIQVFDEYATNKKYLI